MKKNNPVPLIVCMIVVSAILLIPLKVIGYGYLPSDDALRHAAKAVSGRDWSRILVVRPEIIMDSHPGWHAILGFLHKNFGMRQDGLVIFSVVALFILFCFIPVLFLERTEAWLLAMLAAALANPSFMMRLFFGRPYIVTMAAVLFLAFLWPELKRKKFHYAAAALFTMLAALSTWIHCSWYLLLLPILAMMLSREALASFRLTIATAIGVILGACLTGHPVLMITQGLLHARLAFGGNTLSRMLVIEFQPFGGDVVMVLFVCGILMWRYMRGAWNIKCIDNPVFILAVCGWVSGFLVKRFWLDWGMPALMVWMAMEFQGALKEIFKDVSWRRVFAAVCVAAILFVAITGDAGGRWTDNLTIEYLSADDPDQAKWLPSADGIMYTDDMTIFYQTFFRNPGAPWRYILGFEPAWMPAEDLAIFRNIQWNHGAYKSFEPWVKKMRPCDRLVIRRPAESPPKIEALEWRYAATNIWAGRKR